MPSLKCILCRLQVLEYLHGELFPKAGVVEVDRALLKEASCDHAAFRAHSGDGDITWQARLQKSGILCFEFAEAETTSTNTHQLIIMFVWNNNMKDVTQ